MTGPEGEKYDKRKEKDPLEVASYEKPWWLRAYSLPGTPRYTSVLRQVKGSYLINVPGHNLINKPQFPPKKHQTKQQQQTNKTKNNNGELASRAPYH